jgi:hypothetical protein
MIVPMYNAECAPPEVRGAMVGMQQMAITTGIMIAFWIDYGGFDIVRLSQHRANRVLHRHELHWWYWRDTVRCSMARTVVPPDLPSRHSLRRHDLHGNVHRVQNCSALTYTTTALLAQMACPPQPRSRRSQNARQSSQPTARPRLDRARVPRDQSAIYVRKAHGSRTLPTLGRWLGLVYD